MAGSGRIAHIGTGRKVAVLVLKHAFQHQILLAPVVDVR